jgi:hypothetical protein
MTPKKLAKAKRTKKTGVKPLHDTLKAAVTIATINIATPRIRKKKIDLFRDITVISFSIIVIPPPYFCRLRFSAALLDLPHRKSKTFFADVLNRADNDQATLAKESKGQIFAGRIGGQRVIRPLRIISLPTVRPKRRRFDEPPFKVHAG